MNRRTRLLVGLLSWLPRPEAPSPAYLTRVRTELPAPLARRFLGPVAAGVQLRDITVPVGDTFIRARIYRPADRTGPLPLVVNFHGGGFVYGNLTSADWLCGNLAARAGVVVASVDYRLAPEHPAPVPFEDCWAATRWLSAHPGELDIDPSRVSVMGESAGGNLAALVALAGRDRGRTDPDWPGFVRQVLIYPATDLTLSSASVAELADGPLLRRSSLDWYGRCYLPQDRPDRIAGDDPRVSPLLAPDHRDLPPTLIIAGGQDPLRDDALRYADALSEAGVEVRTVLYPEAIHGFVSIPRFEPDAAAALDEVVTELTPR